MSPNCQEAVKSSNAYLITGASGFVGRNLSSFLAQQQGTSMSAIDLSPLNDRRFVHEHTWKTLADVDWLSCDVIVHLAGKAHDTMNVSDDDSYAEVNFGLTKLMFDRFIDSSAELFVYFSSVKAAVDSYDEGPLTETIAPSPKTAYGRSKLMAERYILEQRIPSGKRVVVLRPCMIHGPGNKGNLNLLFDMVRRGVPYPLAQFDNRRSFVSVDNITHIVGRIAEQQIPTGVYNCADDESLSTNEVVDLMAVALGRRVRKWPVSRDIIRTMARVGDYFGLPLNSERLQKLTESFVVSNTKIKSALGMERMPLRARDGFLRTFSSFL